MLPDPFCCLHSILGVRCWALGVFFCPSSEPASLRRGVGLPRSSDWSAPEAGADLPTPPTLPGPVTAGGSRAIFRHIAGAGHVADSLRSYPVAERGLEREAWLTRTADGVGGRLVATPG